MENIYVVKRTANIDLEKLLKCTPGQLYLAKPKDIEMIRPLWDLDGSEEHF